MIATASQMLLVRYGQVPEVARCQFAGDLPSPLRSASVVVQTHRGLQLGTILQPIRGSTDREGMFDVLRLATEDDLAQHLSLSQRCDEEFDAWQERIQKWQLHLQLLDLERTLDGEKLILYVLSERGPDCTKLAIQAAAAGLGIIEVQPVSATGLTAPEESGGGGGCGSGSCGCH